jgi:cell division protein FtsX
VNDLDTRLERLAAAATRDAVPPELAAVARRGRRRRRRQLAGSAALVAAVVAAGLVLPTRLRPGSAPGDGPVTAAATDVTGAGMLGGYWFGKADASVFLEQGVDEARRRAIGQRIEALDVVDAVFHESSRAAYDRFREEYRSRPELLRTVDPSVLPESFRVRLDAPEHFKQLLRELCGVPRPLTVPDLGSAKPRCIDGVDSVVDTQALMKPVVVPKSWLASSDVTVLLPAGTTAAQRQAIRARLRAVDGVARVHYETAAELWLRLPEKVRRADGPLPKLRPASLPTSFRVTLREPRRMPEFTRALCGGRRTGDCPYGVVVLEHPRRSG